MANTKSKPEIGDIKLKIWHDIQKQAPKLAQDMREGNSNMGEIINRHLEMFPGTSKWRFYDEH